MSGLRYAILRAPLLSPFFPITDTPRSYIIALREILPDLGEPEDGRTDEAEVFMSVREGTPKRPYPLEGEGEREEGLRATHSMT